MAMMKKINIEITELFMVKAGGDWHRRFMGEIVKENAGTIRGNVVVNEGKIWSAAENEEQLGKNLDDICLMKLDHKLHGDTGKQTSIMGIPFFLN